MRNGNCLFSIKESGAITVLILPMRNGNDLIKKIYDNVIKEVLILPMRNGNTKPIALNVVNFLFLSYLWGMETINCKRFLILSPSLFLSYLWGMETFIVRCNIRSIRPFLSYLWGMETNITINIINLCPYCSYPTYEEWKLANISFSPSSFAVLILPMRNGNTLQF